MAHFAELNEKNEVIRVIVVSNDDCKDEYGNESEIVGIEFCNRLLGGTWKQTSYNNNIRKQYACIGYTYNADADVFVSPQPFPSWSLDENYDWKAPIPKPDGLNYWDEESLSWKEITVES